MILIDVNALVCAFRSDMPFHELTRSALTTFRARGDVGVLAETAAAFVRIVTDRRVTVQPDEPEAALEFIDALTGGGRFLREPPVSRWQDFREIVLREDVRGPLVPDALLAATCLDLGAGVMTADRDFLRFEGLRVLLITPEGIIAHTVSTRS